MHGLTQETHMLCGIEDDEFRAFHYCTEDSCRHGLDLVQGAIRAHRKTSWRKKTLPNKRGPSR